MTNEYKLSIILPGIRTKNWKEFYNSVLDSFSDTFELIIISPYSLPNSLKNLDNVSMYNDFGSPSRCQQIGLVKSRGEFITWGADDGWFHKNSLDKAMATWVKNSTSYKDIVTCKYFEGSHNQQGVAHLTGETELSRDQYYKINNANGLRSKFIPNDYWILNVGILKTAYAKELGGWDTIFEATAVSHTDFAVRTQRNGSKYFMMKEPIFSCDHMPGTSGDHAPIHWAHIQNDEPRFREIYNDPTCQNRIKIDLHNWEKAPEVWNRRF
tara:strand:- start:3799 stop:4602 length:804 start_codon:yes stop_codon:yes gene_type:complete